MSARTSFEEIYAAAQQDTALRGTAGEAFDAMKTLAKKTAGQYRPANGASYPRSPFGQAMQEIARLAKSDVGLEIAFAESTQWDHHVNEGAATGQIANRLDDFSRGVAALAQDLGDRMADTVILTMSEFGRAVAENGSRGTDHGHGNAMFVIGGNVKGGAGLRQVAGPCGERSFRRPRPRGHDGFPRRVRRDGDDASRRQLRRQPRRCSRVMRSTRGSSAASCGPSFPRIIRPSGGGCNEGFGPEGFGGRRDCRRGFRSGLARAGHRSVSQRAAFRASTASPISTACGRRSTPPTGTSRRTPRRRRSRCVRVRSFRSPRKK